MYNTTTMTAINDGEVRTVYNRLSDARYKVTIPQGWVDRNTVNGQVKNLNEFVGGYGWMFGDLYVPTDNFQLEELPVEFKGRFDLMPAAAAAGPGRGQRRGNNNDENGGPDAQRLRQGDYVEPDDEMRAGMGRGKSNKRSIRRRRRSSSRKSRKSSRKSRNARRK